MARVAGAIAAALVVLSGCTAAEPDNTGGPGLPQQRQGETYPGPRREVEGTFVVGDNGCFLLRHGGDRRFVVWPADATSGGDRVLLADGTAALDGAQLSGSGTVMPVERLAQWPDGYWSNTVGFCDADATEVVVFDSVGVAD